MLMEQPWLIRYKEAILLVSGLSILAEQMVAQFFAVEPNALFIGAALGCIGLGGAFIGDRAIKNGGNSGNAKNKG